MVELNSCEIYILIPLSVIKFLILIILDHNRFDKAFLFQFAHHGERFIQQTDTAPESAVEADLPRTQRAI